MPGLNFPELDNLSRVAVAVSGGGDSMALAHMLATYAATRKKKLHVLAITVDHGLRAESAAEAKLVAKWLSKWPHVTHKILQWSGPKPKTGKMESARIARYALMADMCKAEGIEILAVAHHADDQAETFLMRLTHGSGLDGLAGMRLMQPYNDTLTLYRPLLGLQHADLLSYCKKHKVKWVEDQTNSDQKYTRTRLREALATEGLDTKRLATTLQRLERAASALGDITAATTQKALLEQTEDSHVFDMAILKAMPFEIFLRVLRNALDTLGRGRYGPRLEKLEEIAATIYKSSKKTKATLAGCLIAVDPRGGRLKISREAT
jgi:tRNA(Ile)-lysidine synthase